MSRHYLAAGPWMKSGGKMCRRIVLYAFSPDKLVVHQEVYDGGGNFDGGDDSGWVSFNTGNYFANANLQLAVDRWEQRNLENMQYPHEPGEIKPRHYAPLDMVAAANAADAKYTAGLASAEDAVQVEALGHS